MSLAGVKVGDEVVLIDANRRESWREKVTAIGRKYATIGGMKYEIETGQKADAYSSAHAFTIAQWERREAESAFRATARRLDTTVSVMVTAEEIREATATLEALEKKIRGAT